jgi:hypothetical protein
MNFMDEEHLSRENLTVFVGREWLFRSGSVYCEFLLELLVYWKFLDFPRTPLSIVYSLIQVGSFLIAALISMAIGVRELRKKLKFSLHTAFHLFSVS